MWRWPATSSRISAKKVRSRSSVMTMHSTVAPSSSRMSRMRSWVIGRGVSTPCWAKAIACASAGPM